MILRISRNCHSSPKPSPGIGKLTKSTPRLARQLALGSQFVAGHLQIDDGPDAMALDRRGELVSRELAAAIEHASLGFVPVVPDQAALPIQHDQPARRKGDGQKDKPVEQLTHRTKSWRSTANRPCRKLGRPASLRRASIGLKMERVSRRIAQGENRPITAGNRRRD